MKYRTLFFVMVFFLMVAPAAHAQSVDELIAQLGDPDFLVRNEAKARLIRFARSGLAATLFVDERIREIGLTSEDRETAARSREILKIIAIQGVKKSCEIKRDLSGFVIVLEFLAFDSDGIREILVDVVYEDGSQETILLIRTFEDPPPSHLQVSRELENFQAARSVTIILLDKNGDRIEKDPPLVCVHPDAVVGSDFPIALRGAGNTTEIVLAQASSEATPVTTVFWSESGEILDTRHTLLPSQATAPIRFEGPDGLELGHLEIFSSTEVIATQVVNLLVPGVGSLPPLGIAPSQACRRPAAVLRRNTEIDTGVALSNRGQEEAYCLWTIRSADGASTGSGLTTVPPLGQTQSFPLSAVSASDPNSKEDFEGNIQYDCDLPVHPFSLFQRMSDGAIFSNGVACLDDTIPNQPIVDLSIKSALIAFRQETDQIEIIPMVMANIGGSPETEIDLALEVLFSFSTVETVLDDRHRIPPQFLALPCVLNCKGNRARCDTKKGLRCGDLRVVSAEKAEDVKGECALLPIAADDHGRVKEAECGCGYWFRNWEVAVPGPRDRLPGGSTIVLTIDPRNLVQESDETNNTFTLVVPELIADVGSGS